MPADRPELDPKRRQILEAAYQVFFRYGFARTTMGDLAAAAGLSRPALYLVYPGKAEVFEAVVAWFVDNTVAGIRATLDPSWPLERQLLHVAELAVAQGYDIIKSNPDAADLMSPDRHGPAMAESFARLQALLAELLAPAVARAAIGPGADELARMLMTSMKGFKFGAADGADLRRLIATQARVVAAALGEPAPAVAAATSARQLRR